MRNEPWPVEVDLLPTAISIRPFAPKDAAHVRDLFATVNRMIAPTHLRDQFEAYIVVSLNEEIGRIAEYYSERGGSFWVVPGGNALLGMFGLEPANPDGMELRRMYVVPCARRRGIARRMLQFAEDECRRRGMRKLVLSTSELQAAALALYRNSGFQLQREEVALATNNKTIGGGIRRYHFSKHL